MKKLERGRSVNMNDKEILNDWFDDVIHWRTTDTEPLRFGRVMRFGKHKGEHIYWLIVTYPNYMEWIVNNTQLKLTETEKWWRDKINEQRWFESRAKVITVGASLMKYDPEYLLPDNIDDPHWAVE